MSVCVLCVAGLRVSVSTLAPGSATGERPWAHRSLSVCLSVSPSGCSGRFLSHRGNLLLACSVSGGSGRSILSFFWLPACHDLSEGRWSQWRERDSR